MIASVPMRTNWCTTQLPEIKARSSTVTCPARSAPLARITRFPRRQLWATWELAMRKFSEPTTVSSASLFASAVFSSAGILP